MTRRSGIIAALASVAAAFTGKAEEKDGRRYLSLNLDPIPYTGGREADVEATAKYQKDHPNDGGYTWVVKDSPPPTQQGIEVVYGKRVVRLTPEEIMDALEGK